MTLRGNTLLVALLTGSLIGVVACGDDDDATTTTSSTTTTTSTGGTGGTGGGTTSTGGGGEGGGGIDCTQACTDLFNCGLEDDGNGMQLCPGFDDGMGGGGGGTGVGLDAFLNGANMDGCIAGCEATPAVAALVDPNNCAMTISTIGAASTDFADSCAGN